VIMTEQQLFGLLDNVVSLSILLFVWQLERKRADRLERKNDDLVNVFIDEHKTRNIKQDMSSSV